MWRLSGIDSCDIIKIAERATLCFLKILNFRGGGRGERNGGRPSGSFCRFTLYRLNDLKKRQKGRAASVKGAQTPRGGNKSLQGSKRNAPALQKPKPTQIQGIFILVGLLANQVRYKIPLS